MPNASSPRFRPALVLCLLLAAAPASAQREGLLDVGSPLSDLLERQAAAGHLGASADLLPLSAAEGAVLLDTLAARAGRGEVALSRADAELVARYRGGRPATAFGRRPPLGLYADGVSPVAVAGDGYAFEATPLLYLAAGPARRTRTEARDGAGVAYQNSRGFRVAGHLGRLFFETQALENQRRPALFDYSRARSTTPRLGFVKRAGDDDTYDYFSAEGVVGYRDRFVEARFGRGRNRWGPGMGTLFLSDYAAPYDHLQVRASAGPVRYASTFARFTTPDRDPLLRDSVLPSKYGAFHQLVLSVGRVQIEAFEAVVFHDDTLRGNRRGFEIGYLNPVIFYRSVESEIGSGDNALIGLGASVRAAGARAYGQVLLDEFVASKLGRDDFSNKWGVLAGVHAPEVAPGLEVRAEYARLRPYLYGHRTVSSAYVHYNDVLGHPVGPNADDAALFLRYRPSAAVTAALDVARTRRGRDPDSVYVGADPRVSYEDRATDVAPTLGGVRQTEWLVEARLGYEVLPRLVVEGAAVYQSLSDAERGRDRALTAFLQLRWGLPFRSERY